MQWSDTGIVLSARKHGESSAIVSLLTRDHGRHPGLVRGGSGRRKRGVLQPGNEIAATWRARLSEHLGSYTVELTKARPAAFLDDPLRLAGLSAACAVAEVALPEREAHPAAFVGLTTLLGALDQDVWPAIYVQWELNLLGDLGFGLDLSSCAATGATDNLIYVSPRTGRAVSRRGGRRLPLPLAAACRGSWPLSGSGPAAWSWADIDDGLALTGYFFERHVLCCRMTETLCHAARRRLVDRIASNASTSGV